MMSFSTLHIIVNLSVAIPAIAIFIKIRSDVRDFWPFFAYILLGLANDLFGFSRATKSMSNMKVANMYVLIAFLALIWQFSIWNKRPVYKYWLIALAGIAVWVADNLVLSRLDENNSIFRLFCSVTIVLLGMSLFNRLVAFERNPLSRNPVFVICTAFIIFFGCKSFLESFNLVKAGFSEVFYLHLFFMLSMVNGLSNLLYAYAILCIPKKQEFSLPY